MNGSNGMGLREIYGDGTAVRRALAKGIRWEKQMKSKQTDPSSTLAQAIADRQDELAKALERSPNKKMVGHLFDSEFMKALLAAYPDESIDWLAKNNGLIKVSEPSMRVYVNRYLGGSKRRRTKNKKSVAVAPEPAVNQEVVKREEESQQEVVLPNEGKPDFQQSLANVSELKQRLEGLGFQVDVAIKLEAKINIEL